MESSINRVINGLQNFSHTLSRETAKSQFTNRDAPNEKDTQIPDTINNNYKQKRTFDNVPPSLVCENDNQNVSNFRTTRNTNHSKNVAFLFQQNCKKQRDLCTHATVDSEGSHVVCERSHKDGRSQIGERSQTSEISHLTGVFKMIDESYIGEKVQIDERPPVCRKSQTGAACNGAEPSQMSDRIQIRDYFQTNKKHGMHEGSQISETSKSNGGYQMDQKYNGEETSKMDRGYQTIDRSRGDMLDAMDTFQQPMLARMCCMAERSKINDPLQDIESFQKPGLPQMNEGLKIDGLSHVGVISNIVEGFRTNKRYNTDDDISHMVKGIGKRSQTIGKYQRSERSQTFDNSIKNDKSKLNERSEMDKESLMDERSNMNDISKKGIGSQTCDISEIPKGFQYDNGSQICERSRMGERFHFSTRSNVCDGSNVSEKSRIYERSQIRDRSHVGDRSHTDKRDHTFNRSMMNEKSMNCERSKFINNPSSTERYGRNHGSHMCERPFKSDRSEVRWLCIPGETPRIEQHAVVLASPSEVARTKDQLFCRPANGFGQNWFELEIKDKDLPTSAFRCKTDTPHKNNTKFTTRNDKAKGKRQKKPNNTSEKGTTKAATQSNGKVKRQIQGLKSSPGNKKIHNRYYLNNRITQQETTQTRAKNISFGTADRECNNSNDTKLHLCSSHSQHDKNGGNKKITGAIIRVEGDGRCLFRSLVTCLSPDLQKARRDDFGCPLTKNDANYETLMADTLRAQVVKLMMDNAHFYGQLECIVINADQPMPPGYSHFQDRLMDMTLTSTMPGDLELNATSTALERQVLVLDVNLRPIVVYGKERFPQSEVVAVRYTRLGPDVGHYDAFIPDLGSIDNLDIGRPDKDTNEIKRDNHKVIGMQNAKYDCFSDLISSSRHRINENSCCTSPNSCHKRQDNSCYHYDHHHRRKQHRRTQDLDSIHGKMMDWSPVSSANPVDEAGTQTSWFDDLVNNNNNDNKSSNAPDGPESKSDDLPLPQRTYLRTESNIQSQCNNVILDFLADNVIFMAVMEEDENGTCKKKVDKKLGLMNLNNSKTCPKIRERTGGSVEKRPTSSRLYSIGSSRWKTRQHKSKAVIKKRSKKGTEKRLYRKSHRKAKTKSGIRRRKYGTKTKQKMSRKRQNKKNKPNKNERPAKNPGKLIIEKVHVSNYYTTKHGVDKEKEESEKKGEEVFPTEPRKNLDETLKKGGTGPRCEKSIEGVTPGTNPLKENPTYGEKLCFVCKLPVTQALRLCTLCGRVAHKMCIPASRKGSDGAYFVCSYCVSE